MTNKKRNIKAFAFSDEFMQVLERAKQSSRHTSYTAVIIQAVMDLDRKLNPLYRGAMMTRNLSAEEKAEKQVQIAEAREKTLHDKKMTLVAMLGGEVEVYEEGEEKRVQYYKYDRNYRDLQDIPLDMLTEELVAEQYVPSKEDVLKRQKEGKVKY